MCTALHLQGTNQHCTFTQSLHVVMQIMQLCALCSQLCVVGVHEQISHYQPQMVVKAVHPLPGNFLLIHIVTSQHKKCLTTVVELSCQCDITTLRVLSNHLNTRPDRMAKGISVFPIENVLCLLLHDEMRY